MLGVEDALTMAKQMAKQLILFRHGKSSWELAYDHDRDRPLAKRGIKAAKYMGKLLSRAGQSPDLAITSSALRASSTLELAAAAGKWNCPIQVTDVLYEAEPNEILKQIRAISSNVQILLLTGHEPTWSCVSSLLTGGSKIKVTTAAMVCLEFELEHWRHVEFGSGTLTGLLHPRFLMENKSSY
jgi:phosphohistidine phosphatase